MNDLLNTLFGLGAGEAAGRLRFGEPGAEFGFERPIPAWGWALIVAAAVAAAIGVYARQQARGWARGALASARVLALVLLAVLISGPRLTRDNERTEPDWVAVLVDRSASMTVPDAPGPGGLGVRPREGQLREAAAALAASLGPEEGAAAGPGRRVLWLGFDAGAFELSAMGDVPAGEAVDASVGPGALGEPAGGRTALGAAVADATRRLAGRPVAGIVVLTDGRSVDAPDRQTLRALRRERVGVFPVPLGSAEPRGDVAVSGVEAPSAVFSGDDVPVRVGLASSGGAAGAAAGSVLSLVDGATGETLVSRAVTAEEAAAGEAVLVARPEGSGERRLRVELEPAGDDLISTNNARPLTLELFEGPIRVLYVDGSPRWEQRYLKNILLREPSISSSALLLAADRRFIQEGDERVDRLPVTAEEWAPYDVVILGDVRAGLFGEAQLEGLREHAATRGAGVLWLGGPSHTPGSWHGTPAGDLLPMVSAGSVKPPLFASEVTLAAAPAADRLGVLRLGGSAAGGVSGVGEASAGWSRLRWAQRIEPSTLKAAAEPLAFAAPVGAGEAAAPLVLTMRFGSGRSVYVATDEVWRWRYGRGEALTERFWVPLIRLLARERLARSGRSALLTVSPRVGEPGAPVRLRLELIDQALIDAAPATVRARVAPDPGPAAARAAGASGTAGAGETVVLRPDGPGSFSAVWTGERTGSYLVSADDPLLAGDPPGARFELARPDGELRRPEADHAALERLASATGGRVIDPAGVGGAGRLLPNRERVVAATPDVRTLWDTAPALAGLVLLLGLEWAGRRLVRLA